MLLAPCLAHTRHMRVNAVLSAGCCLLFVDEYGEQADDWEGAPMHWLPKFLLTIARRNVEQGARPDGSSTALPSCR